MDWAFGSDSSARPHIHSSDDRPCYASENPRPKGGTETIFINPDCLRKRGVCPIPAEPVHIDIYLGEVCYSFIVSNLVYHLTAKMLKIKG